jgi:ParB family chromosome partitioning protein
LFAVTAGGRRLKALQQLANEGVIADDADVPCLVEASETAVESSLMENTIRAAMHPVDEFIAMAALIDGGASAEAVAAKFGCSERHVRQRLRLGKLAPELLDAFRAGDASLEVMMAFTIADDHDVQRPVWQQVKDQPYRSSHTVRRLLTDKAVSVYSDLGAFVGLSAYEAAGGAITRDLFSDDDEGFMEDAMLVRRLATEKLEAKAAELRSEWAWALSVLEPEYGFLSQYRRIEPEPAEFAHEITSELDAIEQRLREIDETDEGSVTEELAVEAARLGERYDDLIETSEAATTFRPEDRAIAGCIVTVGDEGEFRIYEGLVERSTEAANGSDPADADDDEFEPSSSSSRAGAPSPTGEQLVRKECGFSQGLVDDLKAHRQQITRAHLAGDFGVAFDLALYAVCADVLDRGYHAHPLALRATQNYLRSSLNDLTGTVADRLLEAHQQALDTEWLSLPPGEDFKAMSALPVDAKQRLFAWCVAATLEAQLGFEDHADPVLEHAGERLAIPFADHWRPTAANYWGRVKKAHALQIAASVLGPRWAKDHADDKKPVLAAALEAVFNPEKKGASVNLARDTLDNAAIWLPPGMAYSRDAEPVETAPNPGLNEVAVGSVDGGGDAGGDDEPASGLPAFLTDEAAATGMPNGALQH